MRFILPLFLILLTLPAAAKKLTFPFMGRPYTLVIPEKNQTKKKPLLVLLHGCKQSSEIILEGTGLDEAALKNDFFVLSPEQTLLNNFDHCWNWFLLSNQQRGLSHELGQIMAAIEMITSTHKIDREQIFLAGISAGGAMAHNLAVCYPDVFKGVALHAGLAYKVAENLYEAQTVLTASQLKSPNYLGQKAWECSRHVSKRRLDRMIIIHGDQDTRVDPYHAELLSSTTEVQLDYLDDGKRNRSLRMTKKEASFNYPHGYSATRIERTFTDLNFREQVYLIKGLGHTWGGGKPVTTHFDPYAPSSNKFILDFFQLTK